MIKFPTTLTPVPELTGYFWDVKTHKLYSIKVGGVLRELKVQRGKAYRGYNRNSKVKIGELYYGLSHRGIHCPFRVRDLKKLTLVDYDVPVFDRPANSEVIPLKDAQST
jgi:hypothetical protein